MVDRNLGSTPRPDPTLLTTQQLIRELGSVREIIETRLNGMDKAIELLQATADKFPARIDEKIASLAGIHEEKFGSIQRQFEERDVRADGTSKDAKTAVDAALQAAKEAVGKSETGTLKQIDSLITLIATGTKATDEKIDDIKQRLTRIEGAAVGIASSRSDLGKNIGIVVGIGGLLLGLVVASGVLNRQPSSPGVVIQQPVPPTVSAPSANKGAAP